MTADASCDGTLGGRDKLGHLDNKRAVFAAGFKLGNGFFAGQVSAKDMPESAPHGGNVFTRHACATHSYKVNRLHRAAECGKTKGGDIAGDGGEPADESETTDAAELMDGREAAQCCACENGGVAAQERAVDEYNIIMNVGVVAYVAGGHHKYIITDRGGDVTFAGGVNGDVLSQNAVFAHNDTGGYITQLELHILWWQPEARAGVNSGSRTHGERTVQADMREKLDIRGEADVAGDRAEGTDSDRFVKLCFGIDERGRVSLRHEK